MRESRHSLWTIPAENQLFWRYYDDAVIVYNAASADTHLLDFLSAETLKLLLEGPKSLENLVSSLRDSGDIKSDDGISDLVTKMLAKLHEIGLAEPKQS